MRTMTREEMRALARPALWEALPDPLREKVAEMAAAYGVLPDTLIVRWLEDLTGRWEGIKQDGGRL